MKVVTKVLETKDYSMFRTLNGNRVKDELHITRLKKSFEKAYLISPIIVNERFEIIDGQHRFEAAMRLGLPIMYIVAVGYRLKEVQILNENMRNWKKVDYLHAYCDLGNVQYLKFREFMNLFPDLSLSICEALLTNKVLGGSGVSGTDKKFKSETNQRGSFVRRMFQEGDFEINNYETAVENANNILLVKKHYDGFNRKTFVNAMISIFKLSYYKHSRLIDRLKANPSLMQHCTNTTQYKLLIEEIYNYRSREKVSLRF